MFVAMNHVGISVTNLERALAFYQEMFRMEVLGQSAFDGEPYEQVLALSGATGKAALLRSADGNFQLELFEFDYPQPSCSDPNRPVCDHGITHFCIEVADIEREYERLRLAGTRFHCPPVIFPRTGNKATYGRDPDGNVFELWERAAAR
jgi:glyoxylase I family protein